MPLLRRAVRALPTVALGASATALYLAARPRPGKRASPAPVPPPGLPPARVVTVPGRGEFFVREAPAPHPDAPTVVLLHGWLFSADVNWHPSYQPLAELARVVALDHRGHGRGPRPSEPFRLHDVADDVAALLRTLDTGPAVAVGYSMGGAVAQLLWQRHPDVVRGLVLAATSGTFNVTARDRWTWRLMGMLQLLFRLAPRYWWESAVRAQAAGALPLTITKMVSADTPREVIDLLPWLLGELDRGSAEDLAEAGREIGRFDARGWLTSVDVPTAVLITMRDQIVPERNQRDLAARIPDALVVDLDVDHDGAVAGAATFVPALLKAVQHVLAGGSSRTGT